MSCRRMGYKDGGDQRRLCRLTSRFRPYATPWRRVEEPAGEAVAAVSCGLYEGQAVLDLDYAEDSQAEADANFVMTASGGLVEIQATAEKRIFARSEMTALLDLAEKGIAELVQRQREALGLT